MTTAYTALAWRRGTRVVIKWTRKPLLEVAPTTYSNILTHRKITQLLVAGTYSQFKIQNCYSIRFVIGYRCAAISHLSTCLPPMIVNFDFDLDIRISLLEVIWGTLKMQDMTVPEIQNIESRGCIKCRYKSV